LLTQNGTNAPVATVLENTLGGTVVWTYGDAFTVGPGEYFGTLNGAFPLGKTIIFLGPFAVETYIYGYRADSNSIYIKTGYYVLNTGGEVLAPINSDDYLTSMPIEIRVYP
jgi:hypothetical protein